MDTRDKLKLNRIFSRGVRNAIDGKAHLIRLDRHPTQESELSIVKLRVMSNSKGLLDRAQS